MKQCFKYGMMKWKRIKLYEKTDCKQGKMRERNIRKKSEENSMSWLKIVSAESTSFMIHENWKFSPSFLMGGRNFLAENGRELFWEKERKGIKIEFMIYHSSHSSFFQQSNHWVFHELFHPLFSFSDFSSIQVKDFFLQFFLFRIPRLSASFCCTRKFLSNDWSRTCFLFLPFIFLFSIQVFIELVMFNELYSRRCYLICMRRNRLSMREQEIWSIWGIRWSGEEESKGTTCFCEWNQRRKFTQLMS